MGKMILFEEERMMTFVAETMVQGESMVLGCMMDVQCDAG